MLSSPGAGAVADEDGVRLEAAGLEQPNQGGKGQPGKPGINPRGGVEDVVGIDDEHAGSYDRMQRRLVAASPEPVADKIVQVAVRQLTISIPIGAEVAGEPTRDVFHQIRDLQLTGTVEVGCAIDEGCPETCDAPLLGEDDRLVRAALGAASRQHQIGRVHTAHRRAVAEVVAISAPLVSQRQRVGTARGH